jgi:hypothetical protein
MKEASKRSIFRWMHTICGIPILDYLYDSPTDTPNYDWAIRYLSSPIADFRLVDGTAMATIGAIRNNTQAIQNQINNLEQDSLSGDPSLNTEVSVLNKINASNVLTLRTLQDSNKLLLSLLEQNVIAAKQQREATANSINVDITRQATLAGNMAQVSGTLSNSLQNFRMP